MQNYTVHTNYRRTAFSVSRKSVILLRREIRQSKLLSTLSCFPPSPLHWGLLFPPPRHAINVSLLSVLLISNFLSGSYKSLTFLRCHLGLDRFIQTFCSRGLWFCDKHLVCDTRARSFSALISHPPPPSLTPALSNRSICVQFSL